MEAHGQFTNVLTDLSVGHELCYFTEFQGLFFSKGNTYVGITIELIRELTVDFVKYEQITHIEANVRLVTLSIANHSRRSREGYYSCLIDKQPEALGCHVTGQSHPRLFPPLGGPHGQKRECHGNQFLEPVVKRGKK